MTEKRYYSVDYDEQYYIFDSDVIRKGRVEEEAEYSYDVFANSMSSTEIIDKLNELTNENGQLKTEKEELLDKLLECQKALSRKRTKEEPHWHKYGNNEGYTKKTDLDIRFCGDVE